MAGATPLVSVTSICYNHERFLVESLDSIRRQTFDDFELTIIDDCSTDGSAARIRQWIADTGMPCQFIQHPVNRGLCATLNEALARARGKYIAGLSTDDVWMPEKLARQTAMVDDLPETVAVVYSDAYQIDETSRLFPRKYLEEYGFARPPTGDLFSRLVTKNFIPAVTTLRRASALKQVGPYDERLAYEDWDMWLRLSQRYEFAAIDYVSAKYRIVAGSMSRTLVAQGSAGKAWSDLLIMEKCLGSPRLEVGAARQARSRMLAQAIRLLRHRDRHAAEAIRRALLAYVRRPARRLAATG